MIFEFSFSERSVAVGGLDVVSVLLFDRAFEMSPEARSSPRVKFIIFLTLFWVPLITFENSNDE